MRFKLWEIIVFTVLVVLAVAFSLLVKVWSGFSYFSSCVFVLILAFFIYNRISYLKAIKIEYDNGLQEYFVMLYNNGAITKQQLEQGDERVINGYYQEYRRTRNFTIIMIIMAAVIAVSVSLVVFGIL